MNSPSLQKLNGTIGGIGGNAAGGDANDEARMEQIRELLHGDLRRSHDARIAGHDARIAGHDVQIAALEQRVRDLETGISAQLEQLHARLEALSGEVMNVRQEHLDELARGFVDMGERVRRLTTRG